MTAESGLPQDTIVNDFAFKLAAAPTSGTYGDLCDAVSEFYRGTQANGHEVGEYISNQVDRGATHELQAWTITAPPMGSPDYTQDWLGPVTAATTDGLPTEVAGVLSFHADLTGVLEESGATRPRARRRGRVYIGPLVTTAVDVATPPYILNTGFLQTLRQAAIVLWDTIDAMGAGNAWCVWSRADSTLRPIVGGWTDNAPDTQRRRGFESTARTVWTP